MLDASFVAAVLEGFEGTLDKVVGCVASPELSAVWLYASRVLSPRIRLIFSLLGKRCNVT